MSPESKLSPSAGEREKEALAAAVPWHVATGCAVGTLGGGRSYGTAGPAEGPVARGLQITGTGLHPSENQRHAVAYEMPPPPGRARDREKFHMSNPLI